MIAMLSTWAFAGEIDVVPLVSNFGIGPLEGRDGWRGGYAAEPWPDYNFGDDIVPQTDDGTTSVTWGTGTALDNWLVQTDVVAVQHMSETDVHALGKQGMMFDQGAGAGDEAVVLAVGEEDHVRIAHGDGAGRVQERRVDRPDL